MDGFDQEHWILHCIYRHYPDGCEWNDPTEEDKRIIKRLSKQGIVYESSRWLEGARCNVPLLFFTEKGKRIFIREDGGFLFESEFKCFGQSRESVKEIEDGKV